MPRPLNLSVHVHSSTPLLLTELFADLEVAAGGINDFTIDCGELETGHILCSGDSVTDITGSDGVATCAIGSGREHR